MIWLFFVGTVAFGDVLADDEREILSQLGIPDPYADRERMD